MAEPKAVSFWNNMPSGDKIVFANMLAGILVWWIIAGKHRYSMKGMKRNG